MSRRPSWRKALAREWGLALHPLARQFQERSLCLSDPQCPHLANGHNNRPGAQGPGFQETEDLGDSALHWQVAKTWLIHSLNKHCSPHPTKDPGRKWDPVPLVAMTVSNPILGSLFSLFPKVA